jgi:hypothetical protein
MPKFCPKISRKKYAHNIFQEKTKMRALCSHVIFGKVFGRPIWPFWFLDISRNVQNRFVKIQFEKNMKNMKL